MQYLHQKVVDVAMRSDLLRSQTDRTHRVPSLSEQEVCAITADAKPSNIEFHPRTGVVTASYLLPDRSDELVVVKMDGLALREASFIRQSADGTNAIIDVTKYADRADWLQRILGVYKLELIKRGSRCKGGLLVLDERYSNGLHPSYGGLQLCMSYSKKLGGPAMPENEPAPAKAL